MLDYRIKTFIKVCEMMNFTRAAELLHITQPAVSNHIRELEKEYSVKLFNYKKKQLILTEAGQMLLKTAITMNHDISYLKNSMSLLNEKAKINFGTTMTIGEYVIPEKISKLIKENREIRFSMSVGNTKDLLKLLDQGLIDFAIVEGFFPKQEYDSLKYREEEYIAVCSEKYEKGKSISNLEDLFEEHLLIREKGSGTREVLERTLKEKNLSIGDFKNLTEIGNLNIIKNLVCEGLGISFFYRPVVQKELDNKEIFEIKLKDCNISHSFNFVWRKGSVFSNEYREIFEMLV